MLPVLEQSRVFFGRARVWLPERVVSRARDFRRRIVGDWAV